MDIVCRYRITWGRRSDMKDHAVALRVTPFLRIECKFWLTDDGWNASCEHLSMAVRADSFEHAKSEMEMALGRHIEKLLGESTRAQRAA
jgi:hypothetical protein